MAPSRCSNFGLANAIEPAGASSASVMNSPTLTARAMQLGMILGTAAYMVPEQARGTTVEKRADPWAFGVVLWEMLTGKCPGIARRRQAAEHRVEIAVAALHIEPEHAVFQRPGFPVSRCRYASG